MTIFKLSNSFYNESLNANPTFKKGEYHLLSEVKIKSIVQYRWKVKGGRFLLGGKKRNASRWSRYISIERMHFGKSPKNLDLDL